MNDENIEEILNKLGTEDVPADVHKIAEETSEKFTKSLIPSRQHIVWSDVLRSRIVRLAAAAVIIMAVLIAVHHFGGSIESVALGQVMESVKKMPWMHIVVEGGGQQLEGWVSYDLGIFATKESSGKIIFHNNQEGRSYRYEPDSKTIKVIYESDDALAALGNSPLNFCEQVVEMFRKAGGEVIKEKGKYQGSDAVIYSVRAMIHENDMSLKLVLDAEKKVPIFINQKMFDASGEVSMEANAVFDYPEGGPADIYEIGAPQNAAVEVVEVIDSRSNPEFLEAIKPYRAARENLPKQWIVVDTRLGDGDIVRMVNIVYTDGRKEKYEYRHRVDVPADNIPVSDGFTTILNWAHSLDSDTVFVHLYDGEYRHNARFRHGAWEIDEKEYSPNYHSTSEGLTYYGWSAIGWGKVIQNDYAAKGKLICIESCDESFIKDGKLMHPAARRVYYLDPEHDYMCVRRENYKHHVTPYDYPPSIDEIDFDPDSTPLEPSTVREVIEFGRLDSGQWYPKKIQKQEKRCVNEGYGWETELSVELITLYIQTEPEFPEGIFDPNKIVPEGARYKDPLAKSAFEKDFDAAMVIIDSNEDWPGPKELVNSYWQARAAKDYGKMAIYWPGSASWNRDVAEKEKSAEYVFGEVSETGIKGTVIVPYAEKSYYEEHRTYNLKMWLTSEKSAKGRYYIISGN